MFKNEDIRKWVSQHYGWKVSDLKHLVGETDINYKVKTAKGDVYLLKITQGKDELSNVEFQIALLNHLTEKDLAFDVPQIIEAITGSQCIRIIEKDREIFLRMQTWVEGNLLDNINPRTDSLLCSWGEICGELNRSLSGFDHPEAHRFYKWNPSETLAGREYAKFIIDPEKLKLALHFWDYFEEDVLPYLEDLRKQINYNDAHELNLLVEQDNLERVSGIIDFGDALYTELVNELAIACAYAGMGLHDPVEGLTHVVKGFHKIRPLQEVELQVLYGLIAARLMITVSNAAYELSNDPDNSYLQISAKPAWDLLFKLKEVSPRFFEYMMREACGLIPHPKAEEFKEWAQLNHSNLAPIVKVGFASIGRLDLSIGSKQLGANSNFESEVAFCRQIEAIIQSEDIDIAVGGYCETRPIYTTDEYLRYGNQGVQWRTTHLGVDIWKEAGTSVYTPLDGVVYACHDNAGDRNYGPTIIIKHTISEIFHFYTLYGHLSRSSLESIRVGQTVIAGDVIGTFGAVSENGNWPPHLHFQIILDMLGNAHDFPGVCVPDEVDVWKSICPDPMGLLPAQWRNVEEQNDQASALDILELRRRHLGPNLSLSYHDPLHIVRGSGAYLYSKEGRKYLDTVNNVAHVGHEHPQVIKAIQAQSALLNTNTRYLHQEVALYAHELQATLPDPLSIVYFVNSGSEANELAIRMAKTYSGNNDFIAIKHGYHGNSNACVDISSYKFDSKGGSGKPFHTHLIEAPDIYRGRYQDPTTAGDLYANQIDPILQDLHSKDRAIAGFICESILSCGGQIVLPPGFLKSAYAKIREAGGLCIADEVQVGFGRVGDHMWGFQLQDVVPDIVVIGKPIGNGHPLAAVVTTQEVAARFNNGMEYFNTFGGNPVSCAIGRTVLQIIKDENLQYHAFDMGTLLIDELGRLQRKFPLIGDVRGNGLFLGVELVLNSATKEAAPEQAKYTINQMRSRGVLMSTDGPLHNVIKIKPPMVISQEQIHFLIDELESVFGHTCLGKFS